jgi:predicted ABC-type ATPase
MIARETWRVAEGGHSVPAATIRRQFPHQGWINFEQYYLPLVDHWELYDNSDIEPVRLNQGDKQ